MRRLIAFFLTAASALAQDNALSSQFERLMGQPNELVTALANFPWKPDPPDAFPGLRLTAPGPTIRVASVERRLDTAARRKHWESEDGAVWVDLVNFPDAFGAAQLLRSARQSHSGYQGDTQILLFSNTGDRRKEAVGAASIVTSGALLNVGVKLPLEVHWDRPLPDADRVAFDAALVRFQSVLEDAARTFLDPSYVLLGAKIEPKPEALPVLRMAGFARLWSYIKYNFVYLDRRPGLNWDSILDQYMPRIAAAKDDIEYGRLLQQAVALLKDGHTGVYPNATAPHDAPLIVLEPVEGKPVATIVGNLPELSAIQPGMELLEIDGTPAAAIIARDIDPYTFSSTIQDRQLRWMRELLQGPPGSHIRTKWLTPDGKTEDIPLVRNGSQHRGALKFPAHPRFDQKDLPGKVAYIGLSDFEDPAAATDFEARFNQLLEAKAWIMDLRWNGGGSSGVGFRILSHFIDAPLEVSKESSRLYNPTVAARSGQQTWYDWPTVKIQPASGPHYQGPVYVLTSPRTCSAAEDFLIPLRMAKRITIVGEPSCGSTGQPLQFAIYGANGRVCTKWDRFPDGTEFVGVGVVPDVKAARTKRDVASARDAVLETAIQLASGK